MRLSATIVRASDGTQGTQYLNFTPKNLMKELQSLWDAGRLKGKNVTVTKEGETNGRTNERG